jgi:hypothetical protein
MGRRIRRGSLARNFRRRNGRRMAVLQVIIPSAITSNSASARQYLPASPINMMEGQRPVSLDSLWVETPGRPPKEPVDDAASPAAGTGCARRASVERGEGMEARSRVFARGHFQQPVRGRHETCTLPDSNERVALTTYSWAGCDIFESVSANVIAGVTHFLNVNFDVDGRWVRPLLPFPNREHSSSFPALRPISEKRNGCRRRRAWRQPTGIEPTRTTEERNADPGQYGRQC